MAMLRKSKILVFALLSLFAAFAWHGCGPDRDPVSSAPEELAPAAKAAGGGIPGRYIVVLRDEVDDVPGVAARLAHAHGGAPEHVYQHALKGFSVALPEQAAEALARNPQVAYIEPDQVVTIVGAPAITGKPGGGGGGTPSQTTPWGITRVGGFADGTGKTAWVIDTGIDRNHPDLSVDVVNSANFVTRGKNLTPWDGHGHGTHVAGTIAALNNDIGVVGVAAGAKVVAVRVLDDRGSGYTSWVIAGVDYVKAKGALIGGVANMSLGGGVSPTLDQAVLNASTVLPFSLAAGNESDDANNHSPARANGDNIYTISAVNSGDVFASFSNYGASVDYAAPGVSVYSTYKGAGYATMNGTSMAAPHMAGILLLGTMTPNGFAIGDPDGNPDPIAHR